MLTDLDREPGLNRRQIASFANDPAAVAAFESLQRSALVDTPASVAAAQTTADAAATTATTASAAATSAQGTADAAITGLDGKQNLDAGLTSLAALASTIGLVEQTAAQTFGVRTLGVANTADIPTRADGDARYVQQDQGATWAAPTGTAARVAYVGYAAPTITGPTIAEVQAISNAVQAVGQAVAALITDLRANGALNG